MTDFRDRLPFEPTVEERKDFDIDCSKLSEHLHNIGAVNKTKKHLYDQGTVSGRKLAHMFTNNKYELKEDASFDCKYTGTNCIQHYLIPITELTEIMPEEEDHPDPLPEED